MSKPVAVITGGSSGIGRALVLKYAQEGYHVVFSGRDERKIAEVCQSLAKYNTENMGLCLDMALYEDNEKLINKTIEKFHKMDVLICNAGISMRALFQDLQLEVFDKVMKINFYGTLYAVKCALPYIIESKGSIIGISSINGWRGTPGRSAYTASKFAMQGFFEALRTELLKKAIHVMVVCPGFTSTNIRNVALAADGSQQGESPRDENKMMSAETVAAKTYQAMKKKKRDVILTSQGKLAVWLNKWAPKMMDKIVYKVMAKEKDAPFK